MKRGLCVLIFVLSLILLVAIAAVVIGAIILSRLIGTTQDKKTIEEALFDTSSTSKFVDLDWWKSSPIYQVYPRSFQDSDGDGTGDLRGIKQRIPYIRDLGIKAIWLSPVHESPMKDFGYDISNYTNIDPIFGDLEDFEELIDEVHKNGMHLIMDFVPGHTSDQHEWFKRSMNNESRYRDYYVWRDKPNNWLSNFGNSAWQYEKTRNQYYLHQFLIEQPDLNYRNPDVCDDMLDTLKWWIDRGVDGFRIDAIWFLVEDAQFRDEPLSGKPVPPNNRESLLHLYTQDQPETYEVVATWTKMLKEYGQKHNKHILTCTEAYTDVAHVMQYYTIGVDFPFNFNLIWLDDKVNASTIRGMIRNWMEFMPAGAWPNWVLGNHDQHRIAARLGGRQYVDIANMLLLLLPGTPTCYYGDEIGMINAEISWEQSVDPAGRNWGPDGYKNFSRDPERTPMQWSNTKNAGFSNGTKTWLPLGDDWQKYNVEEESKDANSHLSIFKALVKLRQEPVFRVATNLRLLDLQDEEIFAFTRELQEARYLIILNFGHKGKPVTLRAGLGIGNGTVVIRSANGDRSVGSIVDFTKPFVVSDAQGYVIKLVD